jgi:hypothetical protein
MVVPLFFGHFPRPFLKRRKLLPDEEKTITKWAISNGREGAESAGLGAVPDLKSSRGSDIEAGAAFGHPQGCEMGEQCRRIQMW